MKMNVLLHLTDKFTTLTTAAPEGRFEKRLKIWASFEEGKVSMNGLQPRKSRAIAVSCSQLHNFQQRPAQCNSVVVVATILRH